jgi:hypothetical protein
MRARRAACAFFLGYLAVIRVIVALAGGLAPLCGDALRLNRLSRW